MKCSNCGRILTGEENFCRICGNKIEKDELLSDESFTDNIDVTKVQMPIKSSEGDINTKMNNNTSELNAMMEIANSIQSSDIDNTEEDSNKVFDVNLSDNKTNDTIQNTQDLLLNSDNDELLLNEPTILVPNDLINSYKKDIDDNNINNIEDKPNNEVDEVIEEVKEEPKKEEVNSLNEIINTDSEDLNNENIVDDSISNDSPEKVKVIYKKKKSFLSVLLGVLFVISLASIGYLSYLLLSSYNVIQSINNSNIKLEDEVSELKEKNNDIEFVINNENNKVFTYNKYIFKVLNNYDYSVNQGVITIKNDSISLDINFDDKIKYTEIKEDLDAFSKVITEKGYTVSSHGTKVEGQREYIFYLVTSSDGKSSLIVYSMIDDNNTIGILINSDNVGNNYEDLKVTNTIIESISIDNNYLEKHMNLFDNKE